MRTRKLVVRLVRPLEGWDTLKKTSLLGFISNNLGKIAGALIAIIIFSIFSFSPSPYTPDSPYPSNNCIGVSPNPQLSWEGGTPKSVLLQLISLVNGEPQSEYITYNIYFGHASNQGNLTYVDKIDKTGGGRKERVRYIKPLNLDVNTTYYWKIVAINELSKERASSTWCFTTVDLPKIPYFSSDKAGLQKSESAILSWHVTNASKVVLEPDGETVPEVGSKRVNPSKTTKYVLRAFNDAGEYQGTVEIKIFEQLPDLVEPKIEYFISDDYNLAPGDSAKLSWHVTNADRVILDPGDGTVPETGTEIVTPSETTVYTLKAINDAGEDRERRTIDVTEQPLQITELPILDSFVSNKYVLKSGESATLSWDVINADKTILEPDGETVSENGSKKVTPSKTTKYTLKASNEGGERRKEVTINVEVDSDGGVIGGVVREDLNQDGIINDGDPGLPGVEVELHSEVYLIATCTTNEFGSYLFKGLRPGSYTVCVDEGTLPQGLVPTQHSIGLDDTIDSDGINVPLKNSDIYTQYCVGDIILSEDEINNNIDFGFGYVSCQVTISDFVWEDLNRNGIQDAGDLGISGVKVNLLDETGNLVTTTWTDEDGYYIFEELCPGAYSVEVEPAKDTPLGAIGDYVWLDINRNGIQDEGEPGILGAKVSLYDAKTGNLINTAKTDEKGHYIFEGLLAGSYIVKPHPPGDLYAWYPTVIGVSCDIIVDSDDHSGTVVVLPEDDSADLDIDFGYNRYG